MKNKYAVLIRVNTTKTKVELMTINKLNKAVKSRPHRILQAYRIGQEIFS